MTNSLRLLGLLGSAGLFALGCNSSPSGGSSPRPIDSTEATSTVNQRVDELVGGLADSTAALDTTDGTTVATGSIGTALGSSHSCTPAGATTDTSSTDDATKSTTQALDDLLHRVAQESRDHVFRDELVETKDGNQVVYKVDPAAACGSDLTCVDKLTNNPIRFAVTANTDDSLNVSLLVGEARYNPGTAVLGSKKLSIRADLAQALAAIRLFVNPEDQQNLPDHLNGVVQGSIEKRAEGDFVISSSVLQKVDLLVGQAKGKPVAVTVLPSDPTTQLTINSVTNTLGYTAALGAVDVQIAGAAVCDDTCGSNEQNGTFSGHLGGVNGGVNVTKGAQELTVAGIGLGNDTSFVALNNDRLGTLDVNANNGRKFSVTFKKTADGTLVTFDPALDIKLALMLNKLSESMRVNMPEWLNDQIFDVMLGGAAKPSVLVPAATCDSYGNSTTKGQLQVVTGNLTMSASSPSTTVSVAAGMCLVAVDGADSNSNPVSQLKSAACQ